MDVKKAMKWMDDNLSERTKQILHEANDRNVCVVGDKNSYKKRQFERRWLKGDVESSIPNGGYTEKRIAIKQRLQSKLLMKQLNK